MEDAFKKANDALEKSVLLVELEKKTKTNKVVLIASVSSSLLGIVLIIMNFGGDLITASIAYIYPTLQSLKAVESMKNDE
ncbi:hypothetical protein HK096_008221, partial [Nowakowskiella sp. JEL0078]